MFSHVQADMQLLILGHTRLDLGILEQNSKKGTLWVMIIFILVQQGVQNSSGATHCISLPFASLLMTSELSAMIGVGL